MKIEIKSRWNSKVLHSGKHRSLKEAVESAVKAGVSLAGANLASANLAGANLARTNITRANITRANITRANITRANTTCARLPGRLQGQ